MQNQLLAFCFFVALSFNFLVVSTQNCDTSIRSLDGSCNNIANPTWGIPGTLLETPFGIRNSTFVFPPAREITNRFFAEKAFKHSGLYTREERITGLSPNDKNLNAVISAFNQLVGHDMSMVRLKNCFTPACFIVSPIPDPDDFLYMTTDEYPIPQNRTFLYIPGGELTYVGTVPHHVNDVSAYIDGGVFYGTNINTSTSLRTFTDGKMLVRNDVGDTAFGELPNAKVTKTFNQCAMFGPYGLASGDFRTETNSILASLHTLFVREHNRLATEFKTKHPSWNDEKIFQTTRKWVIAIYQNILVHELLPTQFGIERVLFELGLYTGYNPNVNVALSNVFAVSANRIPHDQVSLPMLVEYANGSLGTLPGTDGFPDIERINCIADKYWEFGTDAVIRGALKQKAQTFDGKHVDDIRSFPSRVSVNNPYNFDIKGMDLEREREAKIPSYYDINLALTGEDIYQKNGCTAGPTTDSIGCFLQITHNATLAADLRDAYKKISNVEFHVGMLVESDKTSSGFPSLAAKIWLQQIKKARDGDRFWFENYRVNGLFTTLEFLKIRTTKMSDLLKRNTGISNSDIPNNAFKLDSFFN